ncbi:nucleoside kinase [Synechococcus sp. MIT S1220]|uniref:nucleoside kinase n=1 Tax=Synechococcus sp. MIT S1220 TaxID=3082549 RepID=UPI0039B006B9
MALDVPVFCICGASAAGKSTFAAAISDQLQERGFRSLLITCDDYYKSDWVPHPVFGFDTIDAIDDSQLRLDLQGAANKRITQLRHYDMRRRQVSQRLIPQDYDLILLEGSYGPQHLLGHFNFAAFVYLEESILLRLIRRYQRDVRERDRTPFYVLHQMFWEMLPGERTFIHPLREQADLVLRVRDGGVELLLKRIEDALRIICG